MRAFKFVAGAACFVVAWGHIQVRSPPPFRSPFNPAWVWPQEPDWNYKSPLKADGSNFPCKLHHLEENPRIMAEYEAGSEYGLLFDGTATHLGGSCQISISYDHGSTFRVIKSFEGGCPLSPGLNYTIPSYAESSDQAILSWSWFNREGNREMYQNCIPISIEGRNSEHPEHSLKHLPLMYECNINNGCHTVEYQRVCFPKPGPVVVQGNDQFPNNTVIVGERCPHRKNADEGYLVEGEVEGGNHRDQVVLEL